MEKGKRPEIMKPGIVHVLPAFYLMLGAWVAFYLEWRSGGAWGSWGLYPRNMKGLIGIVTMPLLHADLMHLVNNSIPLIVLGSLLRYFYKPLFWPVVGWSWILTGILTWAIGREAFHIGASGLVYALASFLFFSGAWRRHRPLMAVSFFVVFAYGSMVWGLFPIEEQISWEGHLSGAIAGLVLTFGYRKIGPQAPKKEKVEEVLLDERSKILEDEALRYPNPDELGRNYWEEHAHKTQPVRIVYRFAPKKNATNEEHPNESDRTVEL